MTPDELTTFMLTTLGSTGTLLGLTADSLAAAVVEVQWARRADMPNATDVPDDGYSRALARREVWRVAMQQSSDFHNFSEAGASYSREQVYTHAKDQFTQAERDVATERDAWNQRGAAPQRSRTTSRRVRMVF